eukprot:scaffold12931_cov77-Skeletonema_marinoi.AAC.1
MDEVEGRRRARSTTVGLPLALGFLSWRLEASLLATTEKQILRGSDTSNTEKGEEESGWACKGKEEERLCERGYITKKEKIKDTTGDRDAKPWIHERRVRHDHPTLLLLVKRVCSCSFGSPEEDNQGCDG